MTSFKVVELTRPALRSIGRFDENHIFHMQGYRDLPDDFHKKYESVWVTLPSDELCDPRMVQKYLNWNIESSSSPTSSASTAWASTSTTRMPTASRWHPTSSPPSWRVASPTPPSSFSATPSRSTIRRCASPRSIALIDCLSGGRLVAGLPVGSPPDTVGDGLPPSQVRERYYEAWRLIVEAWTRKGPFPFNGRFTKLRYVNPWPKPIQKPHPPIWLAGGGSVETWKFAAEKRLYLQLPELLRPQAGQEHDAGLLGPGGSARPRRQSLSRGFAQLVVVADTDAEAERLYLPHLRNFYSKSLHVPPYIQAPPGFLSKKSIEFSLNQGVQRGQGRKLLGDPATASWKDLTETYGMVVGGSPETVAQQLEEGVRDLRIGHLMAILQIQSMDNELTRYNMRLFADKVLPRLRGLWEREGYQDHWWPSGATRNRQAPATGQVPAKALAK